MKEPPRTLLSIIIVSYNTRDLLRQCLLSLARHSPQAEVIVVDNASKDDSVAMVRSEFPGVEMVALARNKGFAGANNIGMAYARGDIILLLNSDTYLEDDTLDRCAAWLRANPGVGAVSPRLIGFDGVPQLCAHPFPSVRAKWRQTLNYPAEAVEERVEAGLGWLIGAALMVRRAALRPDEELLDSHYFMYWEDTDLSSRLLRDGWSLAVFRDGHVRHLGGGSSSGPDGVQKPALYACFIGGKYRWLACHRTRRDAAGMWMLDWLEAVRKCLRGTVYSQRRLDRRRGVILGKVLLGLLRGQRQTISDSAKTDVLPRRREELVEPLAPPRAEYQDTLKP